MKNTHNLYERTKQSVKDLAVTGLIIYALVGNSYNLINKTGHQSADLATGRSNPTALECFVIESFGGNVDELRVK